MADFVHLHLHTQYSFLDGAIHMAELCPRIGELGMKACAVTEHGNLFGAIDFYRRAKQHGVKPILGVEAYVAAGSRLDRTERKSHHLVLLAKNREGWSNLMFLVSMGYLEGFYYKPRIDKELLRAHAKGLIALTACIGGEVAKNCIDGNIDAARNAVLEYKSIFEPGQFFLEIQENGMEAQAVANAHIEQLSRDCDVPLIATNDCHYKMREDAKAHDVLMEIQHGTSRKETSKRGFGSDQFYIRSPDEMQALFRTRPEAVENTIRVANMIDVELDLGKPMLPTFVPADGSDLDDYLCARARAGLDERFGDLPYAVDRDAYRERLDRELDIIVKMRFPGYFAIVADFINWAKDHDIPVGPGRGSGAGSLVAYALRITDIDPIPYNLLFERFLNPERVSMPDFDVDFCQERRGEVIDYVSQKYGTTHVGQIATFSQLKAKSVIKDVARVLEVPFAEINALTKLLPNTYKDDKGNPKPITIEKALEIEPKLKQLRDENATYKEIIEIAQKLEGLCRQAGIHAAGIVIADADLWRHVPTFRGADGEIVTQFSMMDVEDAGLVKFDFLGLKTLDVIHAAEAHVNERLRKEIARGDVDAIWKHAHIRSRFATRDDLDRAAREQTIAILPGEKATHAIDATLRCAKLHLDDAEVYKLISRGDTLGVFQLESSGFRALLERLAPDCFEDIIAAVALYRPGPLQTGMVDDFIDCKHGRKRVKYPHPLLETVLGTTHGGFVYQEQVMQAAQVMAGYSLGGADLLRRAMGKKKPEVMAKERDKFTRGCVERGIPEASAKEVFDLMEKFAGYGFNKSHSAAYALITYQTAFLKAYYPVEFLAALLSTEIGSTDNIVKYIADGKARGIDVLPPCVAKSEISFTVDANRVRFGLGAIKGLGSATLEAILDARTKGGPFRSIYDLADRVPLEKLNKKAFESLIHSGAFDDFGRPRARLASAIEHAIDAAKSTQRARASGQASLFGAPGLADAVRPREVYDEAMNEWPELERLRLERAALGHYVSGHPLARYATDARRLANATIAQLESKGHRAEVVLACIVNAVRAKPLKDGSGRMAFVTIEDLTGAVEMVVAASLYAKVEELFASDAPLLVKATVSIEGDEEEGTRMRLNCKDVRSLEDARKERTRAIVISVEESSVETKRLTALRDICGSHRGGCPVTLAVRIPKTADVEIRLPDACTVEPSDGLVDRVERLFGSGCVRFA